MADFGENFLAGFSTGFRTVKDLQDLALDRAQRKEAEQLQAQLQAKLAAVGQKSAVSAARFDAKRRQAIDQPGSVKPEEIELSMQEAIDDKFSTFFERINLVSASAGSTNPYFAKGVAAQAELEGKALEQFRMTVSNASQQATALQVQEMESTSAEKELAGRERMSTERASTDIKVAEIQGQYGLAATKIQAGKGEEPPYAKAIARQKAAVEFNAGLDPTWTPPQRAEAAEKAGFNRKEFQDATRIMPLDESEQEDMGRTQASIQTLSDLLEKESEEGAKKGYREELKKQQDRAAKIREGASQRILEEIRQGNLTNVEALGEWFSKLQKVAPQDSGY